MAFMAGRFLSVPVLHVLHPTFVLGVYGAAAAVFAILVSQVSGIAGAAMLFMVFSFESICYPVVSFRSTKVSEGSKTYFACTDLCRSHPRTWTVRCKWRCLHCHGCRRWCLVPLPPSDPRRSQDHPGVVHLAHGWLRRGLCVRLRIVDRFLPVR